jgi:enamine deaminase RidA (YjgF/YER057c/UK114 family)
VNSQIKKSLQDAAIELVPMKAPKYEYVTSSHSGNIFYFSGKTAQVDGIIKTQGKLGNELSVEEGRASARICAINLLSQIETDIGLENVAKILKLTGFVASDRDFYDQPIVVNAASELFVQVLGENGKHARSAIGVAALPGNSPVELELVVLAKKDADEIASSR